MSEIEVGLCLNLSRHPWLIFFSKFKRHEWNTHPIFMPLFLWLEFIFYSNFFLHLANIMQLLISVIASYLNVILLCCRNDLLRKIQWLYFCNLNNHNWNWRPLMDGLRTWLLWLLTELDGWYIIEKTYNEQSWDLSVYNYPML